MDSSRNIRRRPRRNKTIINTAKDNKLTRQEKRERCILALFFFGRVENDIVLLDMSHVTQQQEDRQLKLLKAVDWILLTETSEPHVYKVSDAKHKSYLKYLRKRVFTGRDNVPSLVKCIQYLYSQRIFEYISPTCFRYGIINETVPGDELNKELLLQWYKLNIQQEGSDGQKENN